MKLSIITINRNNAEGLARTMASVFSQSFRDLEYIIVDGASTDSSVSVAEKAISSQSSIPPERILFTSEPDTGIYNAMNKGIRRASGEYLLFLNSGDSLVGESLIEVDRALSEGFDVVIGKENITKNGELQSTTPHLTENDLTLYNLYLYGIPHQAAFIKRALFDEEAYDESLKINADWKFFVKKIVLENASVKIVNTIVSNYDGDGYSSINTDKLLIEREKAFKDIIPARIADNYLRVFPHYYEIKRIEWLLNHRILYKVYRLIASAGMRLSK